ncbi:MULTISPECIES: PP2C family protein-serine/threonine phosphatase [unclassified Streptomyces]|uniref:PP2C family protein-serine/threonine phosphatase n=1 Tax=unclassified Streptomyces TaxID=2593676 RepID=UPI0035E04209
MLGDVCGRGANAAATLVRRTARPVAPLPPDPEAVVQAVSSALCNRPDSHGSGIVTLVYGHLTPAPNGLDIELIRAGHTLPLILGTHHTTHTVEADGSLLGTPPDTHLRPHRLHSGPRESLLLYTDGVFEACDTDGEQFGEERLADAVTSALHRPSAHDVIDALARAVRTFTGDHEIDDDQAVLLLTATSR